MLSILLGYIHKYIFNSKHLFGNLCRHRKQGGCVWGVKKDGFSRDDTPKPSSPLHKCLRAVSAVVHGRPPLPLNRLLSLTRRRTHLVCTHRHRQTWTSYRAHTDRHIHITYAYIVSRTNLTPSHTQPSSYHPPPPTI